MFRKYEELKCDGKKTIKMYEIKFSKFNCSKGIYFKINLNFLRSRFNALVQTWGKFNYL